METFENLVEILSARAQRTPEKAAYHYVEGGQGVALSCAELEQQARAVAALLAQHCRPGDRALMLYPPGTEFVAALFGCFMAGVIAVPAPPPHPARVRRSMPRVLSIAASSRPRVGLTVSSLVSALKAVQGEYRELEGLLWVSTDGLPPRLGDEAPQVAPARRDVAVLQYTSGSTADPKGVILTHGNLMHNLAYFDRGWNHGPESVVVSWLPAFHDLGLVYGLLTPLALGFPSVIMSPVEVIQYPFRWLESISKYRATHSGGPNFMYDLCVRKVSPAQRATLDLSSWVMALNAAEPVRAETLRSFYETFRSCGLSWKTLCPGYGLSEGTCKVAASAVDRELRLLTVETEALERNQVVPTDRTDIPTRTFAGCGVPGEEVEVVIVDPETRRACAPEQVGEIWVAGESVGGGYWERPEATRADFEAHRQDSGEGPYLRTGDLGFVYEDEIYITGRLKDLIIIRGVNHYPQDIEFTAQEAHPALRPGCCAAFSIELHDEEQLAVVIEVERRYHARRVESLTAEEERRSGVDRRQEEVLPPSNPTTEPLDVEEVKGRIRQAVSAEHGLRVAQIELIVAGSIPKTSSGKIQRRACKGLLLAGKLERIPEL